MNRLKNIIRNGISRLTIAFILTFYLYFGIIIINIFQLYHIGFSVLFLTPRIFLESFILFFLYSSVLILLRKLFYFYRFVLSLFLVIFLSLLAVQYFSLYYSGNFLIREALVEYKAFFSFLGFKNILICTSIFFFGLILFNWLSVRTDISWGKTFVQLISNIGIFGIAFSIYIIYQKSSENYASSFPAPRVSPDVDFVKLLFSETNADINLSPDETKQLINQYGLSFTNDSSSKNKLLHPSEKLIFRHTTRAKANVIIFFVESLSARFLTPYESKFDSITPNINHFSDYSTVVDGYYNHTTPTINGLLGQLNSIYPSFINEDFLETKQNFQTRSIINILNDHGYNTLLFSYEHKAFPLSQCLKGLGFYTTFFKQDLELKYNIKSTRNDFLEDGDVLGCFTKYLSDNTPQKPFLAVVSTVNTHTGYQLSKKSLPYKDYNSSLLTAIHTMDNEFGKFWSFFINSKLKDNTIVILTADHSLPVSVELKDLYPEENFTNNLFDKIALIIYDPVHKLPSRLKAHCSSINLAPTVMHLLSIDSISSHFQGHSIFDNPTDSTFLSIYSGAVYEKRINEKTFIDRRTNYLISNWLKYNQQLFRNNKLIPTKSQY